MTPPNPCFMSTPAIQGFRLVFGLKIWSPAFSSRRARFARATPCNHRKERGGRWAPQAKKNCHDSQFCQRAFVLMKTARAPQAHGTLLLPYFLWLVKVVKAERLVKEAETVMVFVG